MTFADPTQRNCMTCGKEAPTWALTYHQNIGILLMHIRKSMPMQVCRSCVHKEYWKRFGILITVGWTSYYSIIIGPVLLVMNTATYIKNLAGKPTAIPEALPQRTRAFVADASPASTGLTPSNLMCPSSIQPG